MSNNSTSLSKWFFQEWGQLLDKWVQTLKKSVDFIQNEIEEGISFVGYKIKKSLFSLLDNHYPDTYVSDKEIGQAREEFRTKYGQ